MEDTDFDLLCEGASPEEAKRLRKLLAEWFAGDESGFPLQFVLITRAQWRAAAKVPEHIRTECRSLETAFGEQHQRMAGLLAKFETAAELRLKALEEGAERQSGTAEKLFKDLEKENGVAKAYANTVKAEQGATDSGGTVVAHNRLEGNRIGLTVRRLRNLTVADNHVTGNCAGVFVVGDENKPRAGALTVRDNLIDRNNKSCPKTARLDALQGTGIVLTGAEDTLVTRNRITGNAGASPLSGGIVVWKSFVGTTSERNRITENVLENNAPADIVNTDTAGKGNTFSGNTCAASKPAGLC